MSDKISPGECVMPNDGGNPICNIDGELKRKEVDDGEPDAELIEEETSPDSFADKIVNVWKKTP